MKKIILDKDKLYDLYINQNLGVKDIAKIFNVYSRVVERNLKEYGIVKSEEQYQQYRSNVAIQRSKKCEELYRGNGFASTEITNKIKETMLNKYGNSDIGFANKDIQKKAQNTIKEKYNVSAISKDPKIKEKISQTTMRNFGVKRAIQLDSFKQKALITKKAKYNLSQISQKISDTYKQRTGYAYPSQNPEIKKIIKQKMNNKRKEINDKIKATLDSKYNRDSISQVIWDDEVYKILKSREDLIKYIDNLSNEDKNIYKIADNLHIHYQTLFKYLREYDIIDKVSGDGSNFEKQVRNFLEKLDISYKLRIRTIIAPYELDIYVPNKNLAIECNGTFWHSSKIIYDKNYHYNKSKMCEEKGIRLIHVWEYEWNNERQRPILENIIKNALGINENKIYARKCTIIEKPSKEMKDFFNKNNIQGFRPGKFSICLEYEGEIIMAYQMGACFFGKGKYQWEVIRGATKLGTTVVGGASKIWKYFIKKYNPNNCVYYIDYNYFNGNSLPYLNLKYLKTQISFKNYFVNEGKVKNRDPIHHSKIKQLEKQGLVYPIYNAGTKVYVWNSLE